MPHSYVIVVVEQKCSFTRTHEFVCVNIMYIYSIFVYFTSILFDTSGTMIHFAYTLIYNCGTFSTLLITHVTEYFYIGVLLIFN